MDNDDECFPKEREYRGALYKDTILREESALSFSDPQNWKSFGIGIRLVMDNANRFARGGSWNNTDDARPALRGRYRPTVSGGSLGFRLARDWVK